MSEGQQDEAQVKGQGSVIGVFAVILVFVVALAGVSLALAFANSTNDTSIAGNVVEVTVKEWSVTAPQSAHSGDVTFVVTNKGTMPHELLVVRSDALPGQIPLTDSGDPPVPVSSGADKISEDGSVGETGGDPLVPGETRTFTVTNLEPGSYQLLCNIAGHYKNGMWSAFLVL